MGYKAKSKEQLDKEGSDKFPPLASDTYLMELEKVEETTEPNPFDKTPEFPDGKPRTQAKTVFKPLTFLNGDELVDINDDPVHPDKRVTIFFDLDRLGFSKTGPSIARRFLAALSGQDVEDDLEVDDWDVYYGNRFQVTLGMTEKGRNKCVDIRRARRGKAKQKVEAEDEAPKAKEPEPSPEDLLSKAADVFGEEGF